MTETAVPILMIDDDEALAEMLREYLAPERLALDSVTSGEVGIHSLKSGDHRLLILDIMLPGTSGLDVLKQLRSFSDIPTIMLTAKGDDVDRILGLELGADDYLSKPFNPRELLARIKALLRRSPGGGTAGKRLQVGELAFDVSAQRVTAGDAVLRLTGTEFALLQCLARSAGSIVSKDELSQTALGRRHMPYDRSIDTHVSNVRGKLADAGVTNPQIQSRRGLGYALLVDDSA
ncbi:MAG: response regulator transcription factor [Pseudomonadota bacterium]